MVKQTRWEEIGKVRLPRPSNIPTTVWARMGYLQRYNLSNGDYLTTKKKKVGCRFPLGHKSL